MIIWGISANSHNGALAVFKYNELVFASETERFSGIKNDAHLDPNLIDHVKNRWGEPDLVCWYENPYLKSLRQFYAGQGLNLGENNIKKYLKSYGIHAPLRYSQHHHSHAAAGYYTSTFTDACVVVIDSIGEFETLTVWNARDTNLKKVYSQRYPHSVGLWYSAMTQRLGLKPNEEEYILMGMAAYGDPKRFKKEIYNDFFEDNTWPKLKINLHRGCRNWRSDLSEADYFDIAASTQEVYEELLDKILSKAKKLVPSKNLVLMGGCALNCKANYIAYKHFENLWIMPAPGDSGSSIGAVLAYRSQHIRWPGPNIGFDMGSQCSNQEIVDYLLKNKICGLARGPAEFGPRALGNRSLLADPRGTEIKDLVNEIKRRQKFRPFAPAVLAEYAKDYFDVPGGLSPYMQVVAACKFPDIYPAIVHADGTSRVQTVEQDNSPFRKLLELWFETTGCPILLNTSLNIKGQPMVNNIDDARAWEQKYSVKVFT